MEFQIRQRTRSGLFSSMEEVAPDILRFLRAAGTLLGFASGALIPGLASPPAVAIERATFTSPPASVRPMTWWHWVNGNVSRNGIEQDLQAMKAAGLGGFHLLDVAMTAPGPVRYDTAEWHELRSFALTRGRELGLEVGVTTGPGWSVAGGPWVKPEESMKRLAWTETIVTGGPVDQVLPAAPAVQGLYGDVAVLAFPRSADDRADATRERPAVSLSGDDAENGAAMSDGDPETASTLPAASASAPVSVLLRFAAPVTVRNLECVLPKGRWPMTAECDLESSVDGQTFQLVRKFRLFGGTGPTPTTTVTFPATTAPLFRLTLHGPTDRMAQTRIAELSLRSGPRVEDWMIRSGRMPNGPNLQTPAPAEAAAGIAALAPGSIIDLTAQMDANGRLRWKAPPGEWIVQRFGYTSLGTTNHPAQPEATGLEVDKLDASAVRRYLHRAMGRDFALPGNPVSMALTDSWEAGTQNWTPHFPAMFARYAGYDLLPWLPAFTGRVVGSNDQSRRFLWDVRQALARGVAENFFQTVQQEVNARGAVYYCEPYGGPAEISQAGDYCDVPMGEFWLHQKNYPRLKNVASIAHARGLPLVAAESFTALKEQSDYRLMPADFKITGDRAFSQGLNQIFLHTYVHQPYEVKPGFSLGMHGSHFGRHETWWPMARAWTDYLARCQLMLRTGVPVADVALLRIDDAPGIADTADYGRAGQMDGFQYDYISVRDLLAADADRDGLRLKSGMRYRLLVLPQSLTMQAAVAEHLARLVTQGLHLAGPPPQRTPGLLEAGEADQRLARVRQELWADLDETTRRPRSWGAGTVSWGLTANEVFAHLNWPKDFSGADPQDDIVSFHRSTPERDIYFLANLANTAAAPFPASFRCPASRAEIWDPVTGEVTLAEVAERRNGVTTLRMSLGPRQSLFVVFPKSAADAVAQVPHRDDRVVKAVGEITGWQLQLGGEAGTSPLFFAGQPSSLSDHVEARVRHFSGIATYQAKFVWNESFRPLPSAVWVDLGRMAGPAVITVNDIDCGTTWVEPYRADITRALKAGDNTIKLRVAVPWANQLIGSARVPLPAEFNEDGNLNKVPEWLHDSPASAAPGITFSAFRYFTGNEPLSPAGVLGPVQLLTAP